MINVDEVEKSQHLLISLSHNRRKGVRFFRAKRRSAILGFKLIAKTKKDGEDMEKINRLGKQNLKHATHFSTASCGCQA